MACGDDIPQLMPLIRQYWEFDGISGFDPGRIEPVLSRLLADLRLGTVWVAQSGERLIGYLVAVCLLSLEHQGLMAEIDELFVVPQERSRGTGGQLLAAAERALVEVACVRLQLQVSVSNAPARAFYQQRGYTPRSSYQLLEKALPW